MELQWPLIVFTTLVAWSAAVRDAGADGRVRRREEGAGPGLIASAVPWPSAGSRCSSTEHWERIFNGWPPDERHHQEPIVIVVRWAVVAVAYWLVMLRKSDDGASVPAAGVGCRSRCRSRCGRDGALVHDGREAGAG